MNRIPHPGASRDPVKSHVYGGKNFVSALPRVMLDTGLCRYESVSLFSEGQQ
jgi:hypothetical protein